MGNYRAVRDERLLRMARTDANAFAELYDRRVAAVYRFAHNRLGDADVAADVTAETFAVALSALRRFEDRGPGSATAWLLGIARHVARRCLDKGRLETSARLRLGMRAPTPERFADDVVDRLTAEEDALSEALAALPEHLRAAVALRIIDEASYAVVAAALGISEAHARVRVSRGLAWLARLARTREAAP